MRDLLLTRQGRGVQQARISLLRLMVLAHLLVLLTSSAVHLLSEVVNQNDCRLLIHVV